LIADASGGAGRRPIRGRTYHAAAAVAEAGGNVFGQVVAAIPLTMRSR
jgi:hypothetical protein